MTPGVRSLFEGTVEPLLDLFRFRDELAQKERARAQWEGVLARNTRKLERERATLAKREQGTPAYVWQQGAVQRVERLVSKESKNLQNATKAVTKLKSKVATISKRKKVGPALAELEAPVIDDNDGEGAAPASAAATTASAASASAASSASSSAGAAASSDSKPPPPAKKARKQRPSGAGTKTSPQQQQEQQGPSWLVTLLTQHTDCASVVLDFLGGGSALRGIGATAPALRAEVKAALPRLPLKIGNGIPSVAWLQGFGRQQHLAIGGWATKEQHQQLAANIAEAGLPARLQSFSFSHSQEDVYAALLANHEWPQLRRLNCGRYGLKPFLDAVLARPAAIFPHLDSLDIDSLLGTQAHKLLTLHDRGAFPSLASIGRSVRSLYMQQGSAADTAQQLALLRRLPAMEGLALAADVAPFAELITSGGLPNLKCVRDCSFMYLHHSTCCLICSDPWVRTTHPNNTGA